MIYPLFQNSGLSHDTVLDMMAVFDQLCAELGLEPQQDEICDMVAFEILRCVKEGHRDPIYIRDCVRKAVRPSE